MSNLSEITRIELLDRIKEDTKSRFDNRLGITESEIKYYPLDTVQLYNHDKLLFEFKVKDYKVSIEIEGILKYMRDHLNDVRINYTNIRKLLSSSLDKSDL